MANAKKLPSGNWRVRIIDNNGKRKSFTAPTKKEAELKASAYMLTHPTNDKPQTVTLADATEIYIMSREAVLSPTTLNSYRQYERMHFQSLMDADITSIKINDIQLQINELALDRSPKTINNIVTFYLSVLEHSDVYLPKKKLQFPQKQKLKYATPDTTRIKQILLATKGTDIEIPVLLALWCSLRMGEILGLKWSKVNQKSITIDNTKLYYSGRILEKPPKTTESTRTLPMPSYIWEVLKNTPRNGEYIVNMHPNMLRKKFHKLLKDNDIQDCRFHDLRHANCSVMLMLGIPDKYAMQRSGHSSIGIYKNVYVQTFDDEQKEAANKLDRYFEELI